MSKIPLVLIDEGLPAEHYISAECHVIRREGGLSPNGNPFNNGWVMRAADGTYIDHDRYRHDLMERNNLSDLPMTLEKFLDKQFS